MQEDAFAARIGVSIKPLSGTRNKIILTSPDIIPTIPEQYRQIYQDAMKLQSVNAETAQEFLASYYSTMGSAIEEMDLRSLAWLFKLNEAAMNLKDEKLVDEMFDFLLREIGYHDLRSGISLQ
jgi:hypothetical protein